MKLGLLGARKLYTEEAIRAAARQYKLWLPSVPVNIDCDKCGQPFAQKGAWTRHVRSCKGIRAAVAVAAERQMQQCERELLLRKRHEEIRREQEARLKELDRQRKRARQKGLERSARERQERLERLRREQLKRLQREQREQEQQKRHEQMRRAREQREQERQKQREQARRAREAELARQKIIAEEREVVGPRRNLWTRNDSETRTLLFTRCDSPDGRLCVDLEQSKFLDAIEDLGEPYSEWTSSVFDELLTFPRSGPMNRTLRTQLDDLDEQLIQLHSAEGVLQLRINHARALPLNEDDWRSELVHLMVGGL